MQERGLTTRMWTGSMMLLKPSQKGWKASLFCNIVNSTLLALRLQPPKEEEGRDGEMSSPLHGRQPAGRRYVNLEKAKADPSRQDEGGMTTSCGAEEKRERLRPALAFSVTRERSS